MSKREQLKALFSEKTPDTEVLRLVIYDKAFYEHRFLGSGDATANKEFQLNMSQNICYDNFEIMIKSPKGWEIWTKTQTLDCCVGEEKAYILNEQNAALRFGDNINGKVPSIGINNIRITSLVTTIAEKGNMQAFTINEFQDAELFQTVSIFHYKNTRGGKSAPSSQQLLDSIKNTMNEVQRAVTIEDYKEIAMQTPGLALGSVTVIPLYSHGMKDYPKKQEENVVTIVVEPYCMVSDKHILDMYIKNTQHHMEKYRLITTKILVITPSYIALDLFGEVRISNKNHLNNHLYTQIITEQLNEYIDDLQKNKLGLTLYYGNIQRLLEKLDFVEYIRHLQLNLQSDDIEKNNFGDIKIPPHARIYLRSNQIILS